MKKAITKTSLMWRIVNAEEDLNKSKSGDKLCLAKRCVEKDANGQPLLRYLLQREMVFA